MIRPILAMQDPYNAAKEFEKAGWKLDFSNPRESGDPLVGLSLYGNSILLGTMEEKYVKKDAIPFLGTGIEFYVSIPKDRLAEIYKGHLCFHPTALGKQLWGDVAFEVNILGYKFMIAAEQ